MRIGFPLTPHWRRGLSNTHWMVPCPNHGRGGLGNRYWTYLGPTNKGGAFARGIKSFLQIDSYCIGCPLTGVTIERGLLNKMMVLMEYLDAMASFAR